MSALSAKQKTPAWAILVVYASVNYSESILNKIFQPTLVEYASTNSLPSSSSSDRSSSRHVSSTHLT